MQQEQQRIAIAEACGWKLEPTQAKGGWKLYCGTVATTFWWNETKKPTLEQVSHAIPNYPNDLNAMHEAEKMLTGITRIDYFYGLDQQLGLEAPHASSQQRAEAFLRTIGKWKD